MCGIAGIINFNRKLSNDSLTLWARRMADRMSHRGPDDHGVWTDPTGYVSFSHRRLSIIDTSSAGHQPMLLPSGSAITFNGEIYNYKDLRNKLIQKGVNLKTQTDTEILLHKLEEEGVESIAELDGMFAFGFYNAKTRDLTLSRDPFGEKPLYYATSPGIFAFASELHCLAVLPWVDTEIDSEALVEYLGFQYVPAPKSIYRGVKKLPPGTTLRLTAEGNVYIEPHFTFSPSANPDRSRSQEEMVEQLRDLLVQSTERRLVGDVPLGCFLSGGVDSTATVAVVTQELGKKIKTFSLGCDQTQESEHIFAREMSEKLGSEHNELLVDPDIPHWVQKIGTVLDEPLADSSCLPTYLLSEYARKQVTVLLSGDGGDEMFGGYNRYFATLNEEERFNAGDKDLSNWRPGDAYFGPRIMIFSELELASLYGELPKEVKSNFEEYKHKINNSDLPLLSRLRAIDTAAYMPGAVLSKVDRMSMQHSLEVRTPFLNRDIAKFAEKLPMDALYKNGHGKLILKDYVQRFVPREWLDRRKMGFGIDTARWGQERCVSLLSEMLLGKKSLLPNWIDGDRLKSFVDIQKEKGRFHAYQCWSLLILEIWLRTHVAKQDGSDIRTSGWSSIKRWFIPKSFFQENVV